MCIRDRNSAWLGVTSYEKVIQLLKFVDSSFAGTMSAFELVWNNSFITLTTPPASVKSPLSYDYPYYVLVETLGSDPEKDLATFQQVLESALERQLIEDAAIAFTQSDHDWFWKIREDVKLLMQDCGIDQQFDVSLPIPAIGEYIEKARTELLKISGVHVVHNLGHVADGNIHFAVGKTNRTNDLTHQINEVIYQPLQALGLSLIHI